MSANAGRPCEIPAARRRVHVEISGAVQGVGFRPFVYQRAMALELAGWIRNTTAGVCLEAEGEATGVAALLRAIEDAPPPNSSVATIAVRDLKPVGGRTFTIAPSIAEETHVTRILADLATCEDCLREMRDSNDRRYRYPFINCTHCGPRFSIIEDIPYDRTCTAMRHFPMCEACRREYQDPSSRRFHAEAIACPDCGPRVSLWDGTGTTTARDHEAVVATAEAIRAGDIVALKGLGGFHLVADARNEAAITRLRLRKCRPDKPFAVMFATLGAAARECSFSETEKSLLSSPASPIVLARRRAPGSLAPSVAPDNPYLGVFLPYTPLHHLLLAELGFPIVATSGNRSDEPIATEEHAALEQLRGIADLFLAHDRPIVRPVDDSVMRIVGGRALSLRRARGYAPAPVAVGGVRPGIVALGGHMKTTVAVSQQDAVVISQHLGDLENRETRAVHRRALDDLLRLQRSDIRLAVYDLHPDYATTRIAGDLGRPSRAVPHHLAHVVACMAENGTRPPVLGVAWDGTGYGPDGTIWGGEFLLVTNDDWRRVAHLRLFPLPGGERATLEPFRSAIGLLYEAFGEKSFTMDDVPPVALLSAANRGIVRTMLARGVNTPRTSSLGRLFDGFASLCGLRQYASYEGQAAAELEWASEGTSPGASYDFPLLRNGGADAPLTLDWQPALESAIADRRADKAPTGIASAFHDGLAAAIVKVARESGTEQIVLSGGCFQNARLTEAAVGALRVAGFEPVWHRAIPPNDGGIALGQAVWTAWNEQPGAAPCV